MIDNRSVWQVKDHPIIIVIGFCAVTAASTAGLYQTIVIPYQVKVQEVQIADLTRELALMPSTQKTVAERDATITKLRQENLALKLRTIELSKENVFSLDDPYPKSFRRVRIGDLFSKLEEIYPARVTKSDPEDSYASVEVDDFFFSSITFYYDEDAKPKRVTNILFHLHTAFTTSSPAGKIDIKQLLNTDMAQLLGQDSQLRASALKEQLVTLYGPGRLVKRETVWNVKGSILTLGEHTFSIDKP